MGLLGKGIKLRDQEVKGREEGGREGKLTSPAAAASSALVATAAIIICNDGKERKEGHNVRREEGREAGRRRKGGGKEAIMRTYILPRRRRSLLLHRHRTHPHHAGRQLRMKRKQERVSVCVGIDTNRDREEGKEGRREAGRVASTTQKQTYIGHARRRTLPHHHILPLHHHNLPLPRHSRHRVGRPYGLKKVETMSPNETKMKSTSLLTSFPHSLPTPRTYPYRPPPPPPPRYPPPSLGLSGRFLLANATRRSRPLKSEPSSFSIAFSASSLL